MSGDDHTHLGCSGGTTQGGTPVGALIRAAADGELTEAQVAEFERLCAERNCTQDRVKFEQTLKDCCGRVMNAPCCTEALRAKVLRIAAETRPTTPESTPIPAPSRAEAMAPSTRQQSFWRGSPGMVAAAAVLAGAAGVLVLQAMRVPTAQAPAGWNAEQVSYREEVSGFVADEHGRCCKSKEAADAKLVIRDPEKAREHLTNLFGLPAETVTPGADFVRFFGGGDCHVPGADRSAHLRFDAVTPEGETVRLSLFVAPDQQRLPMDEGVTYAVASKACLDNGVGLYAWRSNGILYLLVSEAKGEFCTQVRQALRAPSTLASL